MNRIFSWLSNNEIAAVIFLSTLNLGILMWSLFVISSYDSQENVGYVNLDGKSCEVTVVCVEEEYL